MSNKEVLERIREIRCLVEILWKSKQNWIGHGMGGEQGRIEKYLKGGAEVRKVEPFDIDHNNKIRRSGDFFPQKLM